MKKINIFLGIVIGVVLIIGGWLIFPDKISQFFLEEAIETSQKIIEKEVVLIIDNGEELPKIFEAEFKEGLTAFNLLKEKTEELNIVLKTKTYDFGVLIEAIGDKKNGEDGKYWMYYVNEEMPMAAADKKEIRPGDKVEFKFEKSPF